MLTFALVFQTLSQDSCDGGRHKAAEDHHVWFEYGQLPARVRWLLSLLGHQVFAGVLGAKLGVAIKRLDFSDP